MNSVTTLALEPARWQVNDQGEVFSLIYGDVYASRHGAWSQALSVFVDGCELPSCWMSSRCVRVLETGFGLGVNFLATWATLKASSSTARLQYVAIEKHPFTAQDLRAALQVSLASSPASLAPLVHECAERLIAQWPPLISGYHSLPLDDQTTLTLVLSDVDTVLGSLHGRFDAFYLDGFAPERNASMWSSLVMKRLAELAAPGAIAATWCVADRVQNAFKEAGLAINKQSGLDGAHKFLTAHWPEKRIEPQTLPASVVVIGAGIAGASVARQLASRGVSVTLIERDQPACGASGNPVAVVRPEPGGADNVIAEFSAVGVGWLKRWLSVYGQSVPHDFCGAVRLLRDQRRHDKLAAYALTVPDEWLHELSNSDASALCGQAVAADAFLLPQAGWVDPKALVAALIDHPLIDVISNAEVTKLTRISSDLWCVGFSNHEEIHTHHVVLATAFADLSPDVLGIDSARGQLSLLPERSDKSLRAIVCRDGYITPAINGMHTIGATIQYDDQDRNSRDEDDLENFHRLQRLLPEFVSDAHALLGGRVSWRGTTQDRLPLVGKIAEGLYASIGHGSRGVACAPWCAEFLVTQMMNEPLPISAAWVERLHPLRFSKSTSPKS
jgi:tRNA 5-methylaminomethyl-2-thiouridine biosynthesis bifunctional protein